MVQGGYPPSLTVGTHFLLLRKKQDEDGHQVLVEHFCSALRFCHYFEEYLSAPVVPKILNVD